MNKTSLTPILIDKVPEFVRGDYPRFVQVLRDYLLSLEQDDGFLRILQDWRENTDIPNNIDPYITAILHDMGFQFDQDLVAKKSTIAHLLRDFYLSRGSPDSIQFLSQLLFGHRVQVTFPRDEMITPSYSKYGLRYFIFTTSTNLDTRIFQEALEKQKIQGGVLYGRSSEARADIEKIEVSYGINHRYLKIEVLVPYGTFRVGEEVEIRVDDSLFVEHIIPVASFAINKPGTNYNIGDTIHIPSDVAGIARVGCTTRGPLTQATIENPGSGYRVGDRIQASGACGFSGRVSEVNAGGGITQVTITHPGYTFPTSALGKIRSENGTDAVIRLGSPEVQGIKCITYESPYVNPQDTDASVGSDDGTGAVVRVIPSAVWSTANWDTHHGFVGEATTVIDSDKYQQFSYNIITKSSSPAFIRLIDELVHPTGFRRNITQVISTHSFLGDITGSGQNSTQTSTFVFEHTLPLDFIFTFEMSQARVDTIVDNLGNPILDDQGGTIVATD